MGAPPYCGGDESVIKPSGRLIQILALSGRSSRIRAPSRVLPQIKGLIMTSEPGINDDHATAAREGDRARGVSSLGLGAFLSWERLAGKKKRYRRCQASGFAGRAHGCHGLPPRKLHGFGVQASREV